MEAARISNAERTLEIFRRKYQEQHRKPEINDEANDRGGWARNRYENMEWLAYELLKLLRIVSIRRELALDAFTWGKKQTSSILVVLNSRGLELASFSTISLLSGG